MNAASGPAAAPRSSSSARVPSTPTFVGPVVTSGNAASRRPQLLLQLRGRGLRLLVLRDARGDVRRRARADGEPPAGDRRPGGVLTVGHRVLAVGAQVVEAVGEPGADVPDDLARQLVAARRALGPQRRAALLRQPRPRCGPAAGSGCGCRRCRARGTPASPRAVHGSSGRPRRTATRRRAASRPPSGAAR